MRDILIGIAILFCCFLIGDFIYTEKNTCVISNEFSTNEYKCGVLAKEFDTRIYFFDRYW